MFHYENGEERKILQEFQKLMIFYLALSGNINDFRCIGLVYRSFSFNDKGRSSHGMNGPHNAGNAIFRVYSCIT